MKNVRTTCKRIIPSCDLISQVYENCSINVEALRARILHPACFSGVMLAFHLLLLQIICK